MANQDFEKLLAVIRQLNAQLDTVTGNIARFQREFSKSGAEEFNKALANQRVQAQLLSQELLEAEQRYTAMFNAAKKGRSGSTPPPGKKGFSVDETMKYYTDLSGGPEQTAAQKRKAEEERLLNSLKARVASEQKYAQAVEQARKLNFDVENLYRSQTRGTAGIEQLQFRKYDEGGTERRFDTFVSPNGRATPGISNQFRTFGQGVVRDIGELTKWSIALAAVYGPLQKVAELTQRMIENQTKLAEASIAVNSAFLDQGEIFDLAADSANQAGEAVSGVIDAFTLAYRAAGGGANEVERLATAQKLLNDSLILSKLSTLDQATAIDTLAAALRQSSGDLSKGTELLDSWVRVTQIANVDMATLATGFAVVGDAAEAAGVDADKLNGIIAAVAETGISSGKEAANTARALISGFQSDQARRELEALGIAVTDTTGQMRPFLDIMQELYNLRQNDVIDDTQFSKLTLALGGGTRRQAAYSTFIENFDRVFEVANESAQASGEAEDALAKQLDTVQTSFTKIENAFDSLAQTAGTEGGFLSIIKGAADGTALLVRAFDSLVGILGKATPALAAFLATSAVLKYRGSGGLQNVVSSFGQSLQTVPFDLQSREGTLRPTAGQRLQAGIGTNLLGTNATSGAFQGLLTSLIPAIMNATNEQDRFGKTKAGADIVGGVAGGIIGTLTGAGPIIGAAIGTAIADAFVTKTIAYDANLFGYNKQTKLLEAGTAPGKEAPGNLEVLKQAEVGLYESIGGGNEALGRLLTGYSQRGTELVEAINKAIEEKDEEKLDFLLKGRPTKTLVRELGLENIARQGFATGQQIEFSPESLAYQRASDEARRAYDEAKAAYEATGKEEIDVSTFFTQALAANRQTFAPILENIRNQSMEQVSGERLSGDLKGTAYTQQVKAIQGFDTKALQYYTALGEQFIDVNRDVDDATEAFQAFSDVIIYGSQESVTELTSIVSEIQTLQNLLNSPELKDVDILKLGDQEFTRGELEKRLKEAQSAGAALSTDIYSQARLSRLDIPEVRGDVNKPLNPQDFQAVLQEATALQDQFYQGFLKIPDQMYDSLKGSWDEWAQIVEDSGDVFFETVSNIDPQFFQQAMAKLLEENKLKSQAANPFGIQSVDLPGSMAGQLQGMVDYFSQYLSQNFPQYEQKPEDLGIIFNDYVTGTLHGDNLAIKLALEKLVDINQKQLDGQYNIPEGATFWVPLTAAYYRNKGGAGEGGMPDVSSGEVATGNTDALNRNTDALQQLRDSLVGRDQEHKDSEAFRMKNDPESFRNARGAPKTLKEMQYEHFEREYGLNRRPANVKEQQYQHLQREQGFGAETALPPTFIQQLIDAIKTGFSSLINIGDQLPTEPRRFGNQQIGGQQQVNPNPVSKLDLKLSSTTNITLDGRILASALQNYLATDLLRTEGTQGTVTKRYII